MIKKLTNNQKLVIGIFVILAIGFFALNNPFAAGDPVRICEGDCNTFPNLIDCNPCQSGETPVNCEVHPDQQSVTNPWSSVSSYCSYVLRPVPTWNKQCDCKPDCVSEDEKRCYNGDVYWYDDCGDREDKYEDCDNGCSNGECEDEEPDCERPSDCGSNSFGDNYCFGGNVVKDFTQYFCNSNECSDTTTKSPVQTCTSGCSNGECTGVCMPSCNGKQCGDNGCGGSCGTCQTGKSCTASGLCEGGGCTPVIVGKECGDDGCGGSVGTCDEGFTCSNNQCIDGGNNAILYVAISALAIGGLLLLVKGRGKLVRKRK